MITAIHGPLISQPQQWVLVFDRRPVTRWARWLVWGQYKHVRAYGYVPFLHVWLFHDANFSGVEIWIAADGEPARAMIAAWTAGDCAIVLMPRRPHANRSPLLALSGWCVPSVKRLIGLRSSALRPTTLFADCLRNGGRLHGLQRPSHAHAGAVPRNGPGHWWTAWSRQWRRRSSPTDDRAAPADTAAPAVAVSSRAADLRPAAG